MRQRADRTRDGSNYQMLSRFRNVGSGQKVNLPPTVYSNLLRLWGQCQSWHLYRDSTLLLPPKIQAKH
jgi:hypothetical protein